MNFICRDDAALIYLTGENSLLDGYIEHIDIAKDADVGVEISIKVRMRKLSEHKFVCVNFRGCKEFSFNYSDDYYFYCIESLKFLKIEDRGFYVSFDPYDEEGTASDEDQDLIISDSIELFAC